MNRFKQTFEEMWSLPSCYCFKHWNRTYSCLHKLQGRNKMRQAILCHYVEFVLLQWTLFTCNLFHFIGIKIYVCSLLQSNNEAIIYMLLFGFVYTVFACILYSNVNDWRIQNTHLISSHFKPISNINIYYHYFSCSSKTFIISSLQSSLKKCYEICLLLAI